MSEADIITFHSQDYPDSPGCYLMKDVSGRIIYVGKANSLRSRIGSYFRSPEHLPAKTRVMMGKVTGIDILCTHSEKEALLLEASLIKKHRPRYNIVLRDDKSYILFKLETQATYPRLSLTRKVARNGALYFGPFTSAHAARETLKAVNRIFALRKCKDTTFRNRTRPCLQHHMGRCLAPCVYDVDPAEYAHMVYNLRLFLSGRSKDLISNLRREMLQASEELKFEKAASLRDQIRAIEQTVEQQTVVLSEEEDCDVLALAETMQEIVVGISFIRQGKLLDHKTFVWTFDHPEEGGQDRENYRIASPNTHNDPSFVANDSEHEMSGGEDILRTVLLQFYTPEKFIPERIVLPFQLSDPDLENILAERRGGNVHLIPAWKQRDKSMIELARTNALQSRSHDETDHLLRSVGRKMGITSLKRIEGVDVSHLGGQGVVVGQVVAEEGRFQPEAYRQYTFPELEGTHDDYAALAAWARRRIQSGPPWPDMVLIDGGKGQLAAVHQVLAKEWTNYAEASNESSSSWALAALAKGSRRKGELEERVFVPERKNPLPLRPGSKELLFLQQIRDAAHRFVLSRQKRSRGKKVLDSNLERLPGIGPRTARLLWDKFGSLQNMLQATPEQLETIPGIGPSKAHKLHAALHDKLQAM